MRIRWSTQQSTSSTYLGTKGTRDNRHVKRKSQIKRQRERRGGERETRGRGEGQSMNPFVGQPVSSRRTTSRVVGEVGVTGVVEVLQLNRSPHRIDK